MNIFKILKGILLDQFTLYGGGGKGGGGGSAPSYPDPTTVANATTATNTQTAAYNKALNLNNYSNPFGSQQTSQTGTDPTTGAPIYNTQVSANSQLTDALGGLMGQAGRSGAINNDALSGIYSLNNNYNQLGSQYQNLAGQMGGLNSGLMGLGSQYSGLNSQYASLGNQLNQGQASQAQQQGQDAAYKAQTQYLDPQFSQQSESLGASLANQGLTPGSQAYNNAMTNFNNTKQQAYSNAQNQSILTGSQIGAQNLQNQISGINTQSGLLGAQGSNLGAQAGLYGQQASNLAAQGGLYGQQGNTYGAQSGLMGQLSSIGNQPYSQISNIASMIPGYSGTGQSSAAPADISSLYNNQYQSQLAGYNAGQSSSNNMMSGLFGLGSSAMMGYMMSDRRAKKDILRLGTFPNGLPVYAYRYIGDNVIHMGFMADEVRKVAPHAVMRGADGFDRVNYRLAA